MNPTELKEVFTRHPAAAPLDREGALDGGEPRATPEQLRSFLHEGCCPSPPSKIIVYDHSLTRVFTASYSFTKILTYIAALAEAVEGVSNNEERFFDLLSPSSPTAGVSRESEEEVQRVLHPVVQFFHQKWFPFLRKLVDTIPLEDLSQQRFGNRAKRTWHAEMEKELHAYMMKLSGLLLEHHNGPTTPPATTDSGKSRQEVLAEELGEYMKDSYGNCVRLDYGTGHELHFFILIMICMEEMGDDGGYLGGTAPVNQRDVTPTKSAPTTRTVIVPTEEFVPPTVPSEAVLSVKVREGVESDKGASHREVNKRWFLLQLRKQLVHFVFFEYIHFMRVLQQHYSLEPAGSHGVWGLDDYHHLPYIFGASQLIDTVPPIATKDICDKAKVSHYCTSYYYFEMIQWILDHKTGPFHEHSSMLYNISGVPTWSKTYQGMVKMYAAEVLGKFNVTQHLLFSEHLPWNTHRTS